MDSSAQPDMLSCLPDMLLILIISCLPFKDCVKTSALSKRWMYLYRETRSVAFKESDFVSPSSHVYGDDSIAYDRIAFVRYAYEWVALTNDHQPIDSFEISMSNPEDYIEKINSLIAFAVRKKVKKLVLDFSHPSWRSIHDVKSHHLTLVFELPESVYGLNTLESLKLCGCHKFEPWRFVNPGKLKTISLSYMKLQNLESLMLYVESFSISRCWEVKRIIAGNMRQLAIDECTFSPFPTSLNIPRVDIFSYSGNPLLLRFLMNIDRSINQLHFDFGVYCEYDELMGAAALHRRISICYLLHTRPPTRTFNVCQYLLQVFHSFECPFVIRSVKTQHLVMKTRLHPREFNGIRFLLNNCLDMESLTFDMLPPSSIVIASLDLDFDPQTYWVPNIMDINLRKTLKAVAVRNFTGGPNEVNVVKYLIMSQHEDEIVLEKVELYVLHGLDESQKTVANAGVEMLQRISKHVQVLVHNS